MIGNMRGGTSGLRLRAPAKINVGLHVKGLRPDGYHEIWSILQEINLTDEIHLEDAPDFSLTVTGSFAQLPLGEENLCLKAARLFRSEFNLHKGAAIELNKKIPIGAGLGGGSSDAAAVMKGLNTIWGLGLSEPSLLQLTAKIGSDVPFFILGECCIATGRGDELVKTNPIVQDPMVLVCPEEHISTSWAYKNIGNYPLTSNLENVNFKDSLSGGLRDSVTRALLSNDFESLVFSTFPALAEVKRFLLDSGAYYASLSGSGSSIYGVFESLKLAKKAHKQIVTRGSKYLLIP